MKIALVSPLYESVPPRLYGGTERVVSYLCEELVRLGHDVTLWASGDSQTKAKLVAMCSHALRLQENSIDQIAWHILQVEKLYQAAEEFDIIHFNCDYLHFPLSRRMKTPHVTTLHGRLDLADIQPLFNEFSDMPLISISNHQRRPLTWARWAGTVYHGLPVDLFPFAPKGGDYLAFLGRISPEKGLENAIAIASKLGMPLRIAAKLDKADLIYYETKIKPLLKGPHIDFIGEINEHDKISFLGNAKALLFPIVWPEPFGLVMIEALACGTPVVAFGNGSVPEIIEHGYSGFVVATCDEAVSAVRRLGEIDRRHCRKAFVARFTAEAMARSYLEIYNTMLTQKEKIIHYGKNRYY